MCQVVPPLAFQMWIAGVRVGEASHPGPSASRYFALTEMDTDAEDEDSDSDVLAFQWRRSE